MVENNRRKAILLMAYGSPEKDEDIEGYYTHIRGGRKPSAEELENLRARYIAIGGKSPLLEITNSTKEKLQRRLQEQGTSVTVYAGMKHSHPFISETFDRISADGMIDLIAIALAPHYSKMSVGSYQESVRKANDEHGSGINLYFVNEWYRNPIFLKEWVKRILDASDKKFSDLSADRSDLYFLFTAHSLPERILTWGDPYKKQLLETSDMLSERLGLEPTQHGFAFQSAGHTSEPWLGPDILEKLTELKREGWKKVLVVPVGFVSDHLEILFDLDIETKGVAKGLGLQLERTESFNDSDEFVDVLASVALEKLPS